MGRRHLYELLPTDHASRVKVARQIWTRDMVSAFTGAKSRICKPLTPSNYFKYEEVKNEQSQI